MPPPSLNDHLPPGQPAARHRPKSPTRVLAEAEEQWIFDEEELAHTPSILAGMSQEKEKETRAKGINFIRQVGIMLKLPEITLSTAAIFFNRYLMRMSLVDRPDQKALHHYTLGATCLFLATKVEECCRKMKDLVIACCRVAQKNSSLVVDEQSKDYWRWRDTITGYEDVLLETLCFDLTIEAPHKQLFEMLKYYRLEHHKALRNAAWAFITDSNTTQLCLLCNSRTIAAAALYASARFYEVKIPDYQGRPWWEQQRVQLRDMIKAANYMCENYEHSPGKNGNAAEGGASIYVGLHFDLPSEDDPSSSSREYAEGQGPPWEQTRLRSAQQAITTPLQPSLDELDRTRRAESSMSEAGKRTPSWRDDANGDPATKRRKVEASSTNGTDGKDNGSTTIQDKEDASEEGELEE